MKIKRLNAANIREAMRKVREELGPDAVILSNQHSANGLEIVAAVDYDERLLAEMLPPSVADIGRQPTTARPETNATEQTTPQSMARPAGPAPAPRSVIPTVQPRPAANTEPMTPIPPATDKARVVWSQDPLLVEMRHQLQVMHGLLEQQLSGLAWGELGRQQPHRADLLGRLLEFGCHPTLCLRLADAAAAESDPARAWRLALNTLGRGLSVTGDDILTQGGVVALIGPTGVGKTTTIAKLAARYNLRHGPNRVALITTDSYRIGAFEQLSTFGMILDAPVRLVRTAQELQEALKAFANKDLVLIDTAGMGQRDVRLSQQFALLSDSTKIRSYLVLAANAQHAVLQETMTAFARVPLSGAILTKVDETARLGAALSAVHGEALPVAYLCDGQRVPEDLQPAQVDALIRLGEEFAGPRDALVPDDTLALTFGKRLTAHVHA